MLTTAVSNNLAESRTNKFPFMGWRPLYGDAGFQHRVVMGGVNFLEILHALDARGEERRVAERLEHRLARRGNRDFTGDIQNTASLAVNIGS